MAQFIIVFCWELFTLSCIDISSIKNPKVNDWVEIFGGNISIFAFAAKCNTITYEVCSKIGLRVKRIYY